MLAKKGGTRQTLRVLIGLFPELDAPGGVQRAGRHLAAVMTEFAASRGMECRLLSLNDSPELHRMTVGGREFVFTGCNRGKGQFTFAALKAARRKAKLVLAAHPNLGPVVRMMKFAAPRIKSIVCTHGVEVWEPLPGMRRKALRRASVVLAPSKHTADHVKADQGVSPEKLRVLPWALDPQFEALAAGAGNAALPETFPRESLASISDRGRFLSTLPSPKPRTLPENRSRAPANR